MKKTDFLFKSYLLIPLLFILITFSCGMPDSDKTKTESKADLIEIEEALDEDMAAPQRSKDYTEAEKSENVAGNKGIIEDPQNIEPKIIKTAEIRFEVDNYEKADKQIRKISSHYNAVIMNENERTTNLELSNNMTIKIEPDRFEKFVDTLTSIGKFLHYKNINAKDVTEEFVDLQARLKTKKEVESRFKEILQKAKTIHEILEVENEIRTIREEIESVEGRLKYLSHQVSLSTVELSYYERLEYISKPRDSFFAKVGKAIAQGWYGLLQFFIIILYLWPLWLITGIVLYVILRWVKRRKNKKK